jgi:hypothetical protein
LCDENAKIFNLKHNQLQGLGLLTFSDIQVRRINPSIIPFGGQSLSLFLFQEDSQTAYEELEYLTFLK